MSVAVTLDRAGRPITVHARRHLRTVLRSFVSLPCAQASCTEMPVVGDAIRLLQASATWATPACRSRSIPETAWPSSWRSTADPATASGARSRWASPSRSCACRSTAAFRSTRCRPTPARTSSSIPIEDAVSLVARLLDWTRRQIVPGRAGADARAASVAPGDPPASTARRTGPRGSTSTGTSGRSPTIRWPRSRGMPPTSSALAERTGWRRRHGSSAGRRGRE